MHHHYGPPVWLKVLAEADALNVEPWKDWSPARWIEAMDAAGVRTAISSIAVPGIYFWEGFGNQQAPPGAKLKNDVAAMARDANEYGAKMKTDHPGRFGIWASLPLPLVDESLKEIEYTLDTLKLDGIGLSTSIGAKYLGDESFTPVFEELNRRKAVVYTHPGAAPCCLYPDSEGGPDDTRVTARIRRGRSSAGLRADRRRSFRTSAGSSRMAAARSGRSATWEPRNRHEPGALRLARKAAFPRLSLLRKYYYDTAASANFFQMQALKTLIGTSQVVLGDDHPYGNPITYVKALKELATDGTLTVPEVDAILRDNMLRFMPQLKAVSDAGNLISTSS